MENNITLLWKQKMKNLPPLLMQDVEVFCLVPEQPKSFFDLGWPYTDVT
jgi:hypothetical protein